MIQKHSSRRFYFLTRVLPFLLFVPVLVMSAWPLSSSGADDPSLEQQASIYGLWAKTWPQKIGDPVRFYYFHQATANETPAKGDSSTSGIGLYRYGKVGLNFTHSFHWKVRASASGKSGANRGVLELKFNKTGEVRETPFHVENRDGTSVMVLSDDPRDAPGTRYEKEKKPPPFGGKFFLSAALKASVGEDSSSSNTPTNVLPFDRMWMHYETYEKGGGEFRLYQFQKPALDGRGVGWFHRGDFDNWSTEMLTYRLSEGKIEFDFTLNHERAQSSFQLVKRGDKRLLQLTRDPRNYWHSSSFGDGGQSFIAESAASVLH